MRKTADLARRLARMWLLACLAALLLSFACGCNVVAMQQARIESTMRAAGLEPKDQKHAPNLERAEEFNRILRGFLASGG